MASKKGGGSTTSSSRRMRSKSQPRRKKTTEITSSQQFKKESELIFPQDSQKENVSVLEEAFANLKAGSTSNSTTTDASRSMGDKSEKHNSSDCDNQSNDVKNTTHNGRSRRRSANYSNSISRKSKKLSRQEKEAAKAVALQIKVDYLIDLATYEVKVDAYRGICDPDTYNNEQNINNFDQRSSESFKLKPFHSCYGQLDKLKNKGMDGLIITPDGISTVAKGNKLHNNDGKDKTYDDITTCPCVQRWIEKAVKDSIKSNLNMSQSNAENKRHSDITDDAKISSKDEIGANKDSNDENIVCVDVEQPSLTESKSNVTAPIFDTIVESSTNLLHSETNVDHNKKSSCQQEMSELEKTSSVRVDSFQDKPTANVPSKCTRPIIIDDMNMNVNDSEEKMNVPEKTSSPNFDSCQDKPIVSAPSKSICPIIIDDIDDINVNDGKEERNEPEKVSSRKVDSWQDEPVASAPSKSTCPIVIDDTNVSDGEETLDTNEIMFEFKRPPNESCESDYNPLCLASVGGVVDEYLSYKLCRNSPSSIKLHEELRDFDAEWEKMEQEVDQTMSVNFNQTNKDEMYRQKKLYSLYTDKRFRAICRKYGHVKELTADKATDMRQSIKVNTEKVTTYLKENICISHNETEELLSTIRQIHRSRSFKSFIKSDQVNEESGTLDLCKPVGLQNLGATCYLNSQLQCLSTNLLFLEGLFRWKKSNVANIKMVEAISNLQTLLANMVSGPYDKVCTKGFADSLGLENNVMQDPNEFARLLFDRMQESFHQTSTIKATDSEPLANLLPRIFKGVYEYRTKCLSCDKISSRSEDFMDLPLPIIKLNGKKAGRKDITVQECLNHYLQPEMMDGDNQYYCDCCKRKCNAERSLSISSRPMVLNIQLARYTYDPHTCSKKKLMDPVLLPKTLQVPIALNKSKDKSVEYVLCAVQNHRGKSALTGHYVAEAMDWVTGTWFHFNDEEVTLLENGSSHSYDLDDDLSKEKGSSDAYNLLYVEKECLQTCIKRHINGLKSKTKSIDQIDSLRIDTFNTKYE